MVLFDRVVGVGEVGGGGYYKRPFIIFQKKGRTMTPTQQYSPAWTQRLPVFLFGRSLSQRSGG